MNILDWIKGTLFKKHRKEIYWKYFHSIEGEDKKEYAEKMLNKIEADSISIFDARICLNVLPRIKYEYGYTEDVYISCYKCHKALYDYCIKKEFIDNIDYDEFCNHAYEHFKLEKFESQNKKDVP